MIQPAMKNQGQKGWLNSFAVLLAATLATFLLLAPVATAEPICKEELGAYYVNVGLANTTFGMGIDEAFEATIQRLRPTTAAEVDKLKSFFYVEGKDAKGVDYNDNRQYIWRQEGREYRLFKRVAGKKDVRIEIFTITFPPAKKQQILMRLMNANPGLYAKMDLASKLDVLGIMGVSFRGSAGTVDFINNLKVDTSAALPKVYVGNADVMLYRFALEQEYEGVSDEISLADWADPRVVLSRKDEQFLLDNLGNFYASIGSKADDRDEVMNRFGSAISVNGIKKEDLKYIYLNCTPAGDSTHGAAKSAFIPLKVTEGATSYYPVFIFPAAFGTMDTLYAELRSAALHIRWWNAVANASTGDFEQKDLREALLRARIPYIAAGIAKTKSAGSKATTAEYNIHVSLRALLLSAAKTALNDPSETGYTLPWNVDKKLIMAEGSGSGATAAADGAYNQLFSLYLPDITAFKMADKHLTLTKKNEREQVARNLATAITNGYTLPAAERTQALKTVLASTDLYFDLVRNWKNLDSQKPTALELIDKITNVNFLYDDLDWLKHLTTPRMPLESLAKDPIGGKLLFLADSLKNKKLKNLELKLADPLVVDNTLDQPALAEILKGVKSKTATALTSLAQKNSTQIANIDAVRTRMQEIATELETLQTELPEKYAALAAAKNSVTATVAPQKELQDDSYAAMKSACTSATKVFNPSPGEEDEVLALTAWDYHFGDATILSACTPKVLTFIKARREYQAQVAAAEKEQTVAEKAQAIEVSLEKVLHCKDELMRLNNNVAATNAGIADLNSALQEESFTWKDWIENAFADYFLSNDGASVAYDKLVKKLAKAGVTVETRP